MSQHSEDRLEDASLAARAGKSARILPFERPQSDLQRAIQLRAQEAMDIERDREREANRPQPLRWLVIFLIALIPVVLIFGAVDSFLRVFYKVNETYNAAPAPQQSAPAEEEAPAVQTPGVVMLQSFEQPKPAAPAPADEQPKTNEPAK
jgi:hypothetical protein